MFKTMGTFKFDSKMKGFQVRTTSSHQKPSLSCLDREADEIESLGHADVDALECFSMLKEEIFEETCRSDRRLHNKTQNSRIKLRLITKL